MHVGYEFIRNINPNLHKCSVLCNQMFIKNISPNRNQTKPPTIPERFPNINPNTRPSITPMVTIVNVAKPIAAAVTNILTSIHAANANGHGIYAGGKCGEGEDIEGVLGGVFFFGFCWLKALRRRLINRCFQY